MRKLTEANMSPDEMRGVKRMYRRENYTRFSDHAFGNRHKKRIVLPIDPPESKHKKAVERHITKLGFTPHDYHAGLAKDRHGREVRIGKILSKAGNQKLLAKFNDDPSRKVAGELQVVISRHKGDVHNMSNNKVHPWQSCLSKGGCNHRFLSSGVTAGTHVAYLVKKGDHKARKPLARIALKPYDPVRAFSAEGQIQTRNTQKTIKWTRDGYLFKDVPALTHDHPPIVVPQKRVYGNAPPEFEKTVSKWAEKNFPKTALEYKLRKGVHKDSRAERSSGGLSTDNVKAVLSKGKTRDVKALAKHIQTHPIKSLGSRERTLLVLKNMHRFHSRDASSLRTDVFRHGDLPPGLIKHVIDSAKDGKSYHSKRTGWVYNSDSFTPRYLLASNKKLPKKFKVPLFKAMAAYSLDQFADPVIHRAHAAGKLTDVPNYARDQLLRHADYGTYRRSKHMSLLTIKNHASHLSDADVKDIKRKAWRGSKAHSKFIASNISSLTANGSRNNVHNLANVIHDEHLPVAATSLKAAYHNNRTDKAIRHVFRRTGSPDLFQRAPLKDVLRAAKKSTNPEYAAQAAVYAANTPSSDPRQHRVVAALGSHAIKLGSSDGGVHFNSHQILSDKNTFYRTLMGYLRSGGNNWQGAPSPGLAKLAKKHKQEVDAWHGAGKTSP